VSSIHELAHILALGFLRMHLRLIRQKIKHQEAENLLDYVTLRARVGTGETRTAEKYR
jgi:hypothetical protein